MAKSRSLLGVLGVLRMFVARREHSEPVGKSLVDIKGYGLVDKELYDKGFSDVVDRSPILAKSVESLFDLSALIERGARISRSDIPFSTALRAQSAYVANIDPRKPVYGPSNIWGTPEEARDLIVGRMNEILEQIPFVDYASLPEQLQAIVRDAGQIVYKSRKIAGNTKEAED